MADAFARQSERTFRSVRKPALWGAVAGAVLFSLISFVFDHLLQRGLGGMGLAVISGVAFGGLAGLFAGMIRSHHGGRHGA
jgi:hypothetical protein